MLLITGFTLVGEGINDTLNPLIRERPIDPPDIPSDEAADPAAPGPAEPRPGTATAMSEVDRE